MKAFMPPFFLLLVVSATAFTSCKDKTQTTTEQRDSFATTQSAPLPPSGGDLQLPSVPEITHRSDSALKASQSLPEADEMDVRSPVKLRSLTSSETTSRGVQLFITEVEREDSATIVHGFLQNLWGAGTKLHPEPITVKLTADQMQHAKLLDDRTGKAHLMEPSRVGDKMVITTSAEWNMKPGEIQTVVLAFSPIPKESPSATLIIPGFSTVTAIPLLRE